MLLKASKSILTIFKQYFCENPSKLVSLADFASQKKKDVILPHISVKEIFEKKKMSTFGYAPLWPNGPFFYWDDLSDIYGG